MRLTACSVTLSCSCCICMLSIALQVYEMKGPVTTYSADGSAHVVILVQLVLALLLLLEQLGGWAVTRRNIRCGGD